VPRFIACETGILVSTSYKVMYSSLVESGALREIDDATFGEQARGLRPDRGPRHLMPVRDPYSRLSSFFADKLRRNLPRSPSDWQFCQLVFLPLLGLQFSAPFETAVDELRAVSFDRFIELLPMASSNGHLRPQAALLRSGDFDLGPCTELLPIETQAARLWSALGITQPPSANRSDFRPDAAALSRERLEIVNAIYAEDFDRFGYERR